MSKQKNAYDDYDKTEKAIAEMLTENTGTHFLDSGGAYGRHWERNQCRAFKEEPELSISYYKDEVSFGISTFHYLTSFLEIDELAEQLQKRLIEFAELPENKDEGWLSIYDAFAEKVLRDELGYHLSGGSFNTYNYDNLIDQTLQGQYFSTTGKEYPDYLILQIHGGCDVRGGYTAPRIFKVNEFDYMIIAQNDLNASCKCTNVMTDDGGYHWYVDGGTADKEHGYKLPKYWRVNAERKKVSCTKCKHKVSFSASLQH